MSLEWEVLLRRSFNRDHAGVAALLLAASEPERLGFFPHVEAGIKGLDDWWAGPSNPASCLALAVIGTAPSAAKAAALLTRRNLRDHWRSMPGDRILAVAAAREVDWLGDLGLRLADRLPVRDVWDGDAWEFVAALLRAGEVRPPASEGVVRGWLAGLIRPHGRPTAPLSLRMRDDEHLDLLLPAVFEIDGLGAEIFTASWNEDTSLPPSAVRFPEAVAALVAEGRLERKTVLTATVDRLVRGDRPHALRPFVLLHEALAPTVDEVAAHAMDYIRLLAEGQGSVATVAQTLLRGLDETGRLDLGGLLSVSSTVLLRKEKTLVKAQLSWLERAARRHPEHSGEIFETVAAAFGHPALEIQDRALVMIAKQLPRLAPETVARLAGQAGALAGDLPARAAAIFGAATPVIEPSSPPALPPVEPARMPPPIATPAELAEEIAVLLHDQSGVRWERVLAALVALHATAGRDALATALTPLIERYPAWFAESRWNSGSPFVCLATAIRMATDPAPDDSTQQRHYRAVRIAWQEGRRGGADSTLPTGPDGVLALRAAEIAVHINGSMMPALVSTPTHVNGSIEPAVLLERLTRAESEGWQPWSFDLEQALLRLPRAGAPPQVTHGAPTGVTRGAAADSPGRAAAEVIRGAAAGMTRGTAPDSPGRAATEVIRGAAGLTSPAGRQFAQWLASGGLPDPVSETFVQLGERHTGGGYGWDRPVPRRVTATLRPARDGGLRLERQLLTLTPPKAPVHTPDDFAGIESVLAMVLPHHREVAAAWALGDLAALADQDQKDSGRLLPLLAECSGPVGPALATGLAYALGARHEPDRAAAVDAFLALAAGDEPFAAAVGAALGNLAAGGTVKLSRVIAPLTDAHRAGASAAVWEVLTAALPPLLTTGQRGVPDLLELATQVVAALGSSHQLPRPAQVPGPAQGPGPAGSLESAQVPGPAGIPGLAEVAARSGSTRLVKESRRLQAMLTAST